jgi:hypothetical protein
MRALLAAALALTLFTGPVVSTDYTGFGPGIASTGAAPADPERQPKKNCFRIFGACW